MEGTREQRSEQLTLFDIRTPAEKRQEEEAKHALDELFLRAGRYRTGKSYWDLVNFVSRFRFYSPYNAMLLHIQMPGAVYVAPLPIGGQTNMEDS